MRFEVINYRRKKTNIQREANMKVMKKIYSIVSVRKPESLGIQYNVLHRIKENSHLYTAIYRKLKRKIKLTK